MQGFRVVNLVVQSAYLIGHLMFIVMLLRKRQHTPVWSWFFFAAIAMWLWVSGRFMETIVYLFLPANNAAYVFAANYQYVGNTTAVVAYVIWILFLSGHDRLASSKAFRAFLFACPVVICALVFTNGRHHLIYTKLVMGERVGHGALFVPCVVWSYLILLAGYVISLRFVFRTRRDRVKPIIRFSLFPILPALGVLVRSISGVDRLDYTPMVMAVATLSLYQIIFNYRYVNIISASIREVIEQTAHPIGFFSLDRMDLTYANRAARERYHGAAAELLPRLSAEKRSFEGEFRGEHLKVDVTPFTASDAILVTVTNVTDIVRRQAALDRQVAELETLKRELEESNRNIDAYLGSLYSAEGLRARQDMISQTYATISETFRRVEANLRAARQAPGAADDALRENLALTRDCIAAIRRAVARLKED